MIDARAIDGGSVLPGHYIDDDTARPLHVVHHAAEHEICGQWMIDERDGITLRKYYSLTDKCRNGLAVALERVQIFIRKDPT